jgi:hypothetical protein
MLDGDWLFFMMRVFLSYAESDARFVNELVGILASQGFSAIKGLYHTSLHRWQAELSASPVMLYILSRHSAESEACLAHWRFALEHEHKLITLKLEEVPIPDALGRANLIDYLDFEQIGQQIASGNPGLARDRYAMEVSLRLLIAELAEVERQQKDVTQKLPIIPHSAHSSPQTPQPDDTKRLPDPESVRRAQEAIQKKWEERPVPPLKRLVRQLRKLTNSEGEE